MSMSAYRYSKNINIAKGIIVSGCLVCTLALASGGGGSSGGGSGGSGGSGGGGDGAASGNYVSKYDTGKKLFLERVVCDSCPYASLELNPEKVGEVWPDLKRDLKKSGTIGQKLSWWQRSSIKHYIKKRFSS